MESEDTGVGLVTDKRTSDTFIFNHLEYDFNTLGEEYMRDFREGKPIETPRNYYPGNDPSRTPPNRWRSHGFLLFGNWLNEVYQNTPYDLNDLAKVKKGLQNGSNGTLVANGDGPAPRRLSEAVKAAS